MPPDGVLKCLSYGLGVSIDYLKQLVEEPVPEVTVSQSMSPPISDRTNIKAVDCFQLIAESKRVNKINPEQAILNPLSIAEKLCEQDYMNYNPASEYAGKPAQWADIFSSNSKLSKILYRINQRDGTEHIEIIGDVSVALYPLGKVPFEEDGRLIDRKITVGSLPAPMFMEENRYDVVILNMGYAGQFNNVNNGPYLIEAFLKMVDEFLEDDIFFNNVYVNVYERDISFYEALGFRKKNENYKQDNENGAQKPVLYVLEDFLGGNTDKGYIGISTAETTGFIIPDIESYQKCQDHLQIIRGKYVNRKQGG